MVDPSHPWKLLPPTPRNPSLPAHANIIAEEEEFYSLDKTDIHHTSSSQDDDGLPIRLSLLHILSVTQDTNEAWDAYCGLLFSPSPPDLEGPKIPFAHLHRVARLLASTPTKTREVFLRLLSVLLTIQRFGGEIPVYHWNALMAAAGGGYRKTSVEQFKLVFDTFKDMVLPNAPGASYGEEHQPEVVLGRGDLQGTPIEPDIYTYNTLISVAARTMDHVALRDATAALQNSGLSPDRISHLAMLKYFCGTKQSKGLRETLYKMRQQDLEIGLDGLNACIWGFARQGHLQVAADIYRVLRHHAIPEPDESVIQSVVQELAENENIVFQDEIIPNHITYTTMVQVMSYHGDLSAALNIFMDMLSSKNMEVGAPLHKDENGKLAPSYYTPILPVFRAIFLGFARHGIPPIKKGAPFTKRLRTSGEPLWTIENLSNIFDLFMDLPEGIDVKHQLVYWIMVAFAKTTNNNVALVRDRWEQIVAKFPGPWGGPDNRLQRLKANLYPPGTTPPGASQPPPETSEERIPWETALSRLEDSESMDDEW